MKDMQNELKEETEKWLRKIKSKDIESKGENSAKFLENIKAYVKDSEHFLEEGELIEAFEAVIWAWSWYEIGKELDILK